LEVSHPVLILAGSIAHHELILGLFQFRASGTEENPMEFGSTYGCDYNGTK
jgi:hypothetical protein